MVNLTLSDPGERESWSNKAVVLTWLSQPFQTQERERELEQQGCSTDMVNLTLSDPGERESWSNKAVVLTWLSQPFQTQERELEDNMQLRRRQVELEAASREMGALEEQLGGLDVGNLEQERRSLVNQHNKLQEKVL